MEDIRKTLAHNLRTYRKLANISQEKLGELCGLHRTYIGGIEQQRINVSLKNIGKIALALHINPVFLFAEPDFADTICTKNTQGKAAEKDRVREVMPNGYALCTWKGDSLQLDPIEVDDPDLAMSILVSLIDHGHTDDLAQAFEAAQHRIRVLMQGERDETRDN